MNEMKEIINEMINEINYQYIFKNKLPKYQEEVG